MTAALSRAPVGTPAALPRVRELTFALTAENAAAVEAWLAANARPAGPPERVMTLYLDTRGMDVYHRSPGCARRRYRVRWRDGDAQVCLERKRDAGGMMSLVQETAPARVMDMLGEPEGEVDRAGPGAWFRLQVARRGLKPACLVAFDRAGWTLDGPEGPARIDLDRGVVCWPQRSAGARPDGPGTPTAGAEATLQLRLADTVPAPLRRLLCELRLAPGARSKYRAAADALGLVGGDGGARCSNSW